MHQIRTTILLVIYLITNQLHSQTPSKPEGEVLAFIYENPFEIVPNTSNLPTNTISKKNDKIKNIEGAIKENKSLKINFIDGSTFEGTVRKFYKEYLLNKGTIRFPNGDTYTGELGGNQYTPEFKNGVYTFNNGSIITITYEKTETSITTKEYKLTNGIIINLNSDSDLWHFIYPNGNKVSLSKPKKNDTYNSFKESVFFYFSNGVNVYGQTKDGIPVGSWSIYKDKKQISTLIFIDGKVTGAISSKFPEESNHYYFYSENKLLTKTATAVGGNYYCIKGDLNGESELFYISTDYHPTLLFTKGKFKNGNSIGDTQSVFLDENLTPTKYIKGPIKNFEFHGECTEVYPDGTTCFIGEMNEGIRVKGYYFYPNNTVFEGTFENHKPKYGKIALPNVGYYEGQCNEEGMKGTGKFYLLDGSTVTSNWFDKTSAGAATYTKPSGETEVGVYHFDKNTFEYVDYIGQMRAYTQSLEQANNPQTSTGNARSFGPCGTCNGSGAVAFACTMCKGSGKSDTWVKVDDFGRYSGKGTCIYCRGTGTMSLSNSCRSCNGSGKGN